MFFAVTVDVDGSDTNWALALLTNCNAPSPISQCNLYPILQLIPVFVDEQFSKADEGMKEAENGEEDDEERARKVPRPGKA
jgi:hypothetical protein